MKTVGAGKFKRAGFLVYRASIYPFKWIALKGDFCVLGTLNLDGVLQYVEVFSDMSYYSVFVYDISQEKIYRYKSKKLVEVEFELVLKVRTEGC